MDIGFGKMLPIDLDGIVDRESIFVGQCQEWFDILIGSNHLRIRRLPGGAWDLEYNPAER